MTGHSFVLVGGPDSGKTNYLARFWAALRSRKSTLAAPVAPAEIEYVEDALAHLLKGKFAPRSGPSLEQGNSFSVPVVSSATSNRFEIVVPDVLGELWTRAVETTELPQQWMDALEQATGALLFIRVQSEANVEPLNWVTSAALLRINQPEHNAGTERRIPTQVALCELLRFLESRLGTQAGVRPRVAVLITAWDLLDAATARKGPVAFLRSEYPLFAGRLSDVTRLDLRVFGVSVVGGDFRDNEFAMKFADGKLDETGYIIVDDAETVRQEPDLTLPVSWIVDGDHI